MKSRRNTLLGLATLAPVVAAMAGLRGLFNSEPAQAARVYELNLSDADWQSRLKPNQYQVLRRAGTEAPFSSPLNKENRTGAFNCAACALPLFASDKKFESGTGWPSFWQPLDKAVVEENDSNLFMTRTEVLCRRCGSHMGHVFDDGPKPTGLRYCINGVALDFKAAAV